MNAQDIAHQVALTLGDHAEDYGIDAIVEEITTTYGHVDIDTIDSVEYRALIERHNTTDQADAKEEPRHLTRFIWELTRLGTTAAAGEVRGEDLAAAVTSALEAAQVVPCSGPPDDPEHGFWTLTVRHPEKPAGLGRADWMPHL